MLSETEEASFDLEITSLSHNKTAYLNEKNPIVVSIASSGFDGKANIELFDDGKLVSKKEVDFSTNTFQQISFEHTFGYSGLHKLKATLTAVETKENYTPNNTKSSAIQVMKERMNALILTDKLNWDAAFIQSSIRRNQRWEVTFLQQKRNLWYQKNQKIDLAEQLSKTDAVIIIRYQSLRLNNAEITLLKNYCNEGGGIFYQGFPESALQEILPVQGNFIAKDFVANFSVTSEGKKYKTLEILAKYSEMIPPVSYAYVNPTLQAEILASFHNEEASPACLFQTFGKGKIVLLPFLQLWKWQMRQSEDAYSTFISDMVNWLGNANNQTFYATSDQLMYRLGEQVSISLSAFDETLSPRFDVLAKVNISQDEKDVFSDYLLAKDTGYSISVKDLPVGDYSYKVTDEKTNQEAEGNFTISAENPEMFDVGFNNTLLTYLSAETYGTTFQSPDEITATIKNADTMLEKQKIELPIYRKWYLIILFIVTFCLELFFRKRWGLL
jgi:hypothetical protein